MTSIRDIWTSANEVIRRTRQLVNQGLRPLGLSSAEGNVLFHLFTVERPLRQEDLVAELEISKPAVSRALTSLESKGFIERVRDAKDRRANRIRLTERAQSASAAIESVYHDVFSRAAAALSPGEAALLGEAFRRVASTLATQAEEPKA